VDPTWSTAARAKLSEFSITPGAPTTFALDQQQRVNDADRYASGHAAQLSVWHAISYVSGASPPANFNKRYNMVTLACGS
jgi:hypothetical protein